MELTIKKTYRTSYMSIDVCKGNKWVILMTNCYKGQLVKEYNTWNECQKALSEILYISNAIEAPRKISPA